MIPVTWVITPECFKKRELGGFNPPPKSARLFELDQYPHGRKPWMLQRVSYWILAMLPMLAMDIATIVCLSLMHFHSIGGMSNQKQSCVFFCILTHHTMPKLLTFTVPNKKDQKFSTKTTKNHLRDGHAMSSPMVVPVAPVAPVAPFQGAREAQPQRSC